MDNSLDKVVKCARCLAIFMILVSSCIALLLTSNAEGEFLNNDAPRHALNGVFVKDFLTALPLLNAKDWAVRYYLQYPSLTILFYPPLFYFVEAAFFGVFGVSNFIAQASITLFILLLAISSYALAREFLPRWSSLGVAMMCIGAPEVAFWGRQVMLDIPAFALLASGAYFTVRYIRHARSLDVYFAVLLVLAAIYTKYNAGFIAPVLAVTFLVARGRMVLRDRHALAAGALGIVGSLPALYMVKHFGQVNIASIAGRPGDLKVTTLDAWLYYGKLLPGELGWIGFGLAVVGLGLVLTHRTNASTRWGIVLTVGWFLFGYVFFSSISLREGRSVLVLLFPLALWAAMALDWALPRKMSQAAVLLLGVGTFLLGLFDSAPPAWAGYREVADYVAGHAARDAVVLYSGYRDGNFVFNLRTHEERRDITTVRADKLLLHITVERVRGVSQASYSEEEIAKLLNELGVSLVVYQPGFWEDLEQMVRLGDVLHSSRYRRVQEIPLIGYKGSNDGPAIEIYEPVAMPAGPRRALDIEIGIVGERFSTGTKAP